MAILGHSIGECLLIVRLGHVVGQNRNESQTEITGKLKLHENEGMIWKKKKKTEKKQQLNL